MFQPILAKLYYADPELYEKEYARRLHAENTVHIDLPIGTNPAFVYPDYRMYEKIAAILRVDTDVRLLCNDLPGIALHHYTERCLIGEILQSNHIEGVISTRKELSEILQEVKSKRKPRNLMGIVSQYVMLENSRCIPIRSCQDIRDLYDKLFSYDIGKNDKEDLPDGKIFRRGTVSVISEIQKEIHKGLYPEEKIIAAMEQALIFLETNQTDPLIKIAAFHYLFGYIHPFYDGNGRTDRFISSALLMNELNSLISFRISYTIKEHLSKYYKAFKICNDPKNKGDISPFVHFFLDVILEAENNLLSALTDRREKLHYYDRIMDQFSESVDPEIIFLCRLLIKAALFSNHGISLSELEQYMGLSANTIRKKLRQIPEKALIRKTVDRKSFYALDLDEIETLFSDQAL